MVTGKIIGALLGFYILRDVTGIIFGALTGHALDLFYTKNKQGKSQQEHADTDKSSSRTTHPKNNSSTQHSAHNTPPPPWLITLTQLAAKVAKSDGQVSKEEIRTFRNILTKKNLNTSQLESSFNSAKRSINGVSALSLQLSLQLDEKQMTAKQALDVFVQVALKPQTLHPITYGILTQIAKNLNISVKHLDANIRRYQPNDSNTNYNYTFNIKHKKDFELLGLTPQATKDDLKKAYRQIAMSLHPDTAIARKISEKQREAAEKKLALVNAAYKRLLNANHFT